MGSLSKISKGFKTPSHCETILIHLTIVTIKDVEGKYRKLVFKNLNSFNKEDSAFLSSQRPDKDRKLF